MAALGVRFGKALQLTNVLRDVPRDLASGRCYLPADELAAAGLAPADLLEPANAGRARAVLVPWIRTALGHFEASETYLLATPRSCTRLRLAALWPILLGLATLERLAGNPAWLDPARPSRVGRKWVYGMMARSMAAVHSDTLLRLWIRGLRRRWNERFLGPDSRPGMNHASGLMSVLEVFVVFLRLGLTSFGGPVAHLGYFRQEIVVRRGWLDEAAYADLVALCQFLPGPASSQVGIALGIRRAGLPGGFAAWLGFTAPSAAALILFAYGVAFFGDLENAGWLSGLKTAAVAVVALAVWGMANSLCPDRPRAGIAIVATLGMLVWPTSWAQLLVIGAAGVVGWTFLQTGHSDERREPQFRVNRAFALVCLAVLAVILVAVPVLQRTVGSAAFSESLQVFDSFFRAGALVFGGGHVVLPLLKELVVTPVGLRVRNSSPDTAPPRLCPGRCSRSRPIWASSSACPPVGPGVCSPWAPCSCPHSCWLSGRCLSGTGCAAGAASAVPCGASMRRWWDCCWPHCTTRSGPAPSTGPGTSRWHCSPWGSWLSGNCRRGWWCCCQHLRDKDWATSIFRCRDRRYGVP